MIGRYVPESLLAVTVIFIKPIISEVNLTVSIIPSLWETGSCPPISPAALGILKTD